MAGGLDPEVVVALAAAGEIGTGCCRRPVFASSPLPAVQDWPMDEQIFLDASAVSAGDASLVKLAILHRRPGGWERLYLQSLGPRTPPALYLPGAGERERQALVYVVELAAMLALSRASRVAGEPLGGERLIVKHGPLVQQLSQYMSPVYWVEERTAEAALLYAGLDPATASLLLRRSRVCDRPGTVSPGLLALRLLEELTVEARGGARLFAGVVEDTSRSGLLAAAVLAEAIQAVAAGASHANDAALRLAREALSWSPPGACGTPQALLSLQPRALAAELVAPLAAELQTRFQAGLFMGSTPPLRLLEAGLASSRVLPDIRDEELLLNLLYYDACRGSCSHTRPRSRAASAEWARLSIEQRIQSYSCHGDAARLTAPAAMVIYSYVLPDTPPSCTALASLAKPLGMTPEELAGTTHVGLPIRVEAMTPAPYGAYARLLAAVLASSRLVLYRYPPQLLVVDAASRVTWTEYRGLELLAEQIARRRRPYNTVLRGWRRRAAMTSLP